MFDDLGIKWLARSIEEMTTSVNRLDLVSFCAAHRILPRGKNCQSVVDWRDWLDALDREKTLVDRKRGRTEGKRVNFDVPCGSKNKNDMKDGVCDGNAGKGDNKRR